MSNTLKLFLWMVLAGLTSVLLYRLFFHRDQTIVVQMKAPQLPEPKTPPGPVGFGMVPAQPLA